MTSAVLAALAVWCLMPESAARRTACLIGASRERPRLEIKFVAGGLAPVAAVLLLGPVLGLLIGLALAPVAIRVVQQLESAESRKRAAELAAALPTALDLMVSALEAGRPPVSAFALVAEATPAPLGNELAAVGSRLQIAGDAAAVWQSLTVDPVLGSLGRAFGRAHASGMPVADVVAGVASELRRERAAERRQQSRKIAVQTAGPLGACFLPAFFLIGIVPMIASSFVALMP